MRALKYFIIVTMILFLASCVAAVVAGAAAGLVYDKRGVVTMEADARLFHVIHKNIVSNPQFIDSRIEVTSFNRVVLLVGQASTEPLRNLAGTMAERTPGVTRVYNEITVGNRIPLSQCTLDTWITGEVRSAMLAKKGLESGSIRIITENRVVYLMGIVTNYQAELAVDVARRIKGVVKVVKVFQYIH